MITDANISHAAPRSNMSRPLKRGRACINCRILKIKCDGHKPICGSCQTHPKDDDCEYLDDPARSRTKALEDAVSRLEARLHELEHPEVSTPSVMLHDPCASTSLPQLTILRPHSASRSLPISLYHPQPQLLSPSNSPLESLSSPLSPFSPHSPTGGSPPYQSRSHLGPSPLGIFDTRTTSPSPSEPNVEEIQTLLDSFLANASEFGFFLHERRFYESALLLDNSKRPTPFLLHAAYTCGAHFLHLDQEGRFLQEALRSAATDLAASRPHPQAVLHTIQAEVLISHYFFQTGRFVEAQAHAGTAVALVLGSPLLNRPTTPSDDCCRKPAAMSCSVCSLFNDHPLWKELMHGTGIPSTICRLRDQACQVSTNCRSQAYHWPVDPASITAPHSSTRILIYQPILFSAIGSINKSSNDLTSARTLGINVR
ncbi:hypothetical protein C8J57DRAFT_192035 [Mycena rebaudengoi]|nr:hypothetical protein C8J57DRAFT_192035 [Mycena rebaudengoi]